MTFACTSRFLQFATIVVILGLSTYSVQAVKCFECEGSVEKCTTGECEGEFCKKIMAKDNNGGTTLWTWGCSTSTVLSPIKAGCQKSTATQWTQNTCYCKDKDYCNASPPAKKIATEYITLLSAAIFAGFLYRRA